MFGLELVGLPAALYLRISDDREGQRLGVKRQEDDGRHHIDRLGVVLTEDHLYIDNDISAGPASNKPRDGYDSMVQAVRDGKVKVIVAYSTSRLTRRTREAEDLIDLAVDYGLQLIFVASPYYDLTTADGREAFRRDAARDTGEVDRLRERIVRKKLEDAREGKTKGGRRTYGYSKVIGVNPATGKDICDPYQVRDDEIAMLQEGKRRTLAGDSQFVIVKDWNERGIRTSLGHKWDVGRFKRTLLNESYVQFDPTGHPTDCPCLQNPDTGGTRIHGDVRHRAKWPAVFSHAEHGAMVAVFNGRDNYWSNKGRLKGRTYLLSGIIICGGAWKDTERTGQPCEGYMYGQGKKENGRYIRRYACKKWDHDGSRLGCCTVFRIADPVETFVTEQVLYRFDSPEVARALTPTDNEERMAEVIQRLAELQARREQLAAEYAAGEHDKDDYRVMVDSIKQKITAAEATKKQLLSTKAKSLAVPTDGGLREVWQTASIAWRASVIKLVVEKVVIHPGRPGGKRWPDANGWRFDPDLVEIVWLH
jgi:DNA invertase Pin-like site-specific DNA recombinase